MFRALLGILLVAGLAGCEPGTSTDSLAPDLPVTAKAAVVASATGSGHHYVESFDGGWRTWSFTARAQSDGTVGGRFEVHNRSRPDVDNRKHFLAGPITCLSVVGNRAWIGGVVDQASGAVKGYRIRFSVIDNGEGRGVIDQITGMSPRNPDEFPDADLDFCREMPAWELRDVEAGNIQVRGEDVITP